MSLQREQIATIALQNGHAESDIVIVNTLPENGSVGLCVSSRDDGDAEVWMSAGDCQKVVKALQKAVKQLSGVKVRRRS